MTQEEKKQRQREYARRWYQKHRELIRTRKKENHPKIREKCREYKARTHERILQKQRDRYWQDHEKTRRLARDRYKRTKHERKPLTPKQKADRSEATRRYRERHSDRLRALKKERLALDSGYRFLQLLGRRIRLAIKAQYAEKAFKTEELVGCSMKRLRRHFEKQFIAGMGWHNYGYNGWHIDHITPCATFDLSKPDQQKLCFHYRNLRPVWAHENIARGSRIEHELPLIYRYRKVSQQ